MKELIKELNSGLKEIVKNVITISDGKVLTVTVVVDDRESRISRGLINGVHRIYITYGKFSINQVELSVVYGTLHNIKGELKLNVAIELNKQINKLMDSLKVKYQ